MTQDTLTLYKLIILYMLNRVDFPLTRTQITDFMLDKNFTNFLTLQQVFTELIETEMITTKTIRNRTQLFLTREGEQALRFFKSRIHYEVRQEIDNYLTENKFSLRNELAAQSDFRKNSNGEYDVRLLIREKTDTLMDLTISVPTEKIASDICEHWSEKNGEIYQYLIRELF